MFKSRFKLYTIIRLLVQAAPKMPDGVIYGTMYGEINTTDHMIVDDCPFNATVQESMDRLTFFTSSDGVKIPVAAQSNGTIRVLTVCLMYNMESEVKNSYWGLFGSYQIG